MNYQNLYPIVHDLSAIDTNGCCSMGFQRNGCFSFQDLVDPSFSTMSIDPDEEYVTRGTRVGAYDLSDRHRSDFPDRTTPRNALRSLIDDDRNDVATQEKVQRFDELYVLTRQVNTGNVSQMWECVHRQSGDRYATKIVYKRNLSQKDEEMVFQEVSMLTTVKSCCNNATKFIDFYDEATRFYIVMEYADGGDLLATLAYRKRLSESEAKILAKSILKGLVQLHKEKICHRNLKPENLLLNDQNDLSSVWIADFGMAARILYDTDGEPLKLTERCGTAMYMAPEVISQIPYECQVDIWSFGVLMYYALTGHFPYEDYNRQRLYLKICKNEYSFIPSEWQGISVSAKRFIANILHPDSDVRMTADECLSHPWLEELKEVEPMAEEVELKLSASSLRSVEKKVDVVKPRKIGLCPWPRRRNEVVEDSDDWNSNATQTATLVSSQATETSSPRAIDFLG